MALPRRGARTLLLAAVGSLACATSPRTPPAPRMAESEANDALPIPDPSARGTVQGLRPATTVDRVAVVRLALGPDGLPRVVDFLTPDLTEAEKADLRRAVESGQMPVTAPPEGGLESWLATLRRPPSP